MTPKEKALELVEQFWNTDRTYKLGSGDKKYTSAIVWSLISVNDTIKTLENYVFDLNIRDDKDEFDGETNILEFYIKVKLELDELWKKMRD